MKLNQAHNKNSTNLGSSPGKARVHRGEVTPKVKFKRNDEGKLVRLRRVRRKKAGRPVASIANPNQVSGTDRVTLSSELGKATPVQTKPNAVSGKRARLRSITPGLSNLVKKSTPRYPSPFTSMETTL